MSKREILEMLSRLLPYVAGREQITALFTVVLLLLMHANFDAPHIHIEPAPDAPASAYSRPIMDSSVTTIGTTGTLGLLKLFGYSFPMVK